MKLYNSLKKLVELTSTTFYSTFQQTPEGMNVEIFNYHAEPEQSWDLTDARECRGIMFELDSDMNPVKIISRPMTKFFNLGENHLSQYEDFNEPLYYTEKHDGSLISTYLDKSGKLRFKSKGSLHSDQSNFVNRFMMRDENRSFFDTLKTYAEQGYTVDLEYVGPDNLIVLGYDKPQLMVLSVRHNETGEYILPHEFDINLSAHSSPIFKVEDFDELVEEAKSEKNIEGYIFVYADGNRVKLKTDWYFDIHKNKDEISSNKRLIRNILAGKTDDYKASAKDDPMVLNRIRKFEDHLARERNYIIASARSIVQNNQGLSRGQFAQKALKDVDKAKHGKLIHNIAMNVYSGKGVESIHNKIDHHIYVNYQKFIPGE